VTKAAIRDMIKSHSLQTIIITIGRSLEKVILLISSVLLSRYLPQDEFGTYRQIFLIGGLLLVVLNFGIPHSINFFVPQLTKKKQKSFLFQTFLLQLVLGSIASITLVFGADIIASAFNNPSLARPLRIFSLYPFFLILSSSYSNIFISISKVKIAGILSPILGILKLSVIVFSILADYSLNNIILLIVIFSLIQFLIVISIVLKLFSGIKVKIMFTKILEQLKFAAPIGLSSIFGVLIIKLDQFMVSIYFTVEEYAKYSIGTLEIPFVNLLTASAMAVITPYLVKQFSNERYDLFVKMWRNSILKISYIVFPIATFFVFYATETIAILYTEQYIDGAQIFQIYLLRLFVKVTFFGHILLALGKPKQILYYTIITLIINVILNFVFINVFGFVGAAIATVLSVFIISFLQLLSISNILKIKLKSIWPWKYLALILFVSVLSVIITLFLKTTDLSLILMVIFGFVIFILTYALFTQVILRKLFPPNLHLYSIQQLIMRNPKI